MIRDKEGKAMTSKEMLEKFNAPKGAELVEVFKNGNIKIRRRMECDRCNSGKGIYYTHVCNGRPVPSIVDNGICFKCLGAGYVIGTEILRTPENQAKLDAKHQKKALEWARKCKEAEEARKAEEAREEQERLAEEARIKAEKEISQYVGQIGEKLEAEVTYLYTASIEVQSFYGFGTETLCIHNFKDASGNKLIWKTGKGLPEGIEKESKVVLKGTIKEHKEYKEEKQTILTRCKVTKA